MIGDKVYSEKDLVIESTSGDCIGFTKGTSACGLAGPLKMPFSLKVGVSEDNLM